LTVANVGQDEGDRSQSVGDIASDHLGDAVSNRIVRSGWHVHRADPCGAIEFLDPQMCAGACTGGAKPQLARLRFGRGNEFSDGIDMSGPTCQEHIGLARECSDWDEVPQRVVGEIPHERRGVCLSARVHEQGVTVGR
jgi:hypothetical protein